MLQTRLLVFMSKFLIPTCPHMEECFTHWEVEVTAESHGDKKVGAHRRYHMSSRIPAQSWLGAGWTGGWELQTKVAPGKAKKPESMCAGAHMHTCTRKVARPRKGVRTETGFPLLGALKS